MLRRISETFSRRGLLITALVILILFTRFYNLDSSAPFFWDPARDLMKIHQYFIEKELTLIGPISEAGDRVFGSLTYYMLMPFAVLGNFDPLSTTIGAAFWGSLTALLILLLTRMINQKMILMIAFLVAIWFPLVETSRWTWNPNLIPFWIILGLVLYQSKRALFLYLSGLALGMSFHHHYLAAFSVGTFAFLTTLLAIKQKTIRPQVFFILGLITSILPFIAFDFLHPPGLFLTRFLYFNQTQEGLTSLGFLVGVGENVKIVLLYYTQSAWLALFFGILILWLVINDSREKRTALLYFVPWLAQIGGVALIVDSFRHYFLPGLIFFLAWLIFPREKIGRWLAKGIIAVLILGSLLTIVPQLKTNPHAYQGWQPNIKTVREITRIIEVTINKEKLEAANIAVLGSQDPNTYGWKYRSLLLIKEIRLKSRDEYQYSDYLFVVSQSSEDELRQDPAAEMTNFREGKLKNSWTINDSGWKLYLFEKNSP